MWVLLPPPQGHRPHSFKPQRDSDYQSSEEPSPERSKPLALTANHHPPPPSIAGKRARATSNTTAVWEQPRLTRGLVAGLQCTHSMIVISHRIYYHGVLTSFLARFMLPKAFTLHIVWNFKLVTVRINYTRPTVCVIYEAHCLCYIRLFYSSHLHLIWALVLFRALFLDCNI